MFFYADESKLEWKSKGQGHGDWKNGDCKRGGMNTSYFVAGILNNLGKSLFALEGRLFDSANSE